jgi:DNA invertase Pin-like site-specific DNA recombinase
MPNWPGVVLSVRVSAGTHAKLRDRAEGVKVGRREVVTADQLAQARTLVAAGHRVGDVAETLKVGRSTLYRALSEA